MPRSDKGVGRPAAHTVGVEVPVFLTDEANCRGERLRPRTKRDIWFPPDSDKDTPGITALAFAEEAWAKFCHDCPVLEQCLRHALEHEEYGVWAGTTDFHRRQAREEMLHPRKDPELMEFAMNRARSGYIPFPLPRCKIKECPRVVATEGGICGVHRRAMHIKGGTR